MSHARSRFRSRFHAVLHVQWRAARAVVVAFGLTALALPLVSLRLAWHGPDAVARSLEELSSWGVLYGLLAAVAPVLLVARVTAPDRRGGAVYARVHPVSRRAHAALQLAAGAVLLLPGVAGVAIGGAVAVAATALPPGVNGYALPLACRFALALGFAYALAWAVANAPARVRALAARGAFVGLALVLIVFLLDGGAGAALAPLRAGIGAVAERLVGWPGPLAVFVNRWMLVDV